MKHIIFTFAFILLSIFAKSQSKEVEKIIFGIQTGHLGIWIYDELKLSNRFVLRSEIGFDTGTSGANLQYKTGVALTSVLILEPRWYFKLKQGIANNNGNFFSVKTSYYPGLELISNKKDEYISSNISLIPTIGIRRNLNKNLNYEAGFGFGYQRDISDENNLRQKNSAILNLHLRIGYNF